MRLGRGLSPPKPRVQPAHGGASGKLRLAADSGHARRHAEPGPAGRGTWPPSIRIATSCSSNGKTWETVSEVFRLNHRAKFESIMHQCAGPAAIGHVRYATCGKEGRNYAQPFEWRHIEKLQVVHASPSTASWPTIRSSVARSSPTPKLHLSLETDTEILLHLIAQELSGTKRPTLHTLLTRLARSSMGPITSSTSTPAATCSSPAIRSACGPCATPSEGRSSRPPARASP